ncbi:3D domain-containing protein [Sporosarcina ureilytica]|uniref:LysM domain-containing protein n=1 Tax=Sporosarcina ureilytica TaxID=298596 RepID=A0A1D8JEN8_9BACL|nr:3D domain-containing protein [Sporosarcina ureilytica]AOV07177.1 hypothetical protein BI350_06235 [Sporosarcina ureilytica]
MKKFSIAFLTGLFIFGFGVKESYASSPKYTVKSGDNLYRISLLYNTSVSNLKTWNNLSGNIIFPNQTLIVGNKISKTKTASKQVKKELTMKSTAYTAYCNGCIGITKTGINLRKNPNQKVIAVDPKVIPLGSKVFVEGYGYAVAGDIGSAIKGNTIDVFFPTKKEAFQWGRKEVKVQILD